MTDRSLGYFPSGREIRRELAFLLQELQSPAARLFSEGSFDSLTVGSYEMVRLVRTAVGVQSDVDKGNPVSRLFKRTTVMGDREVKWADERDLLGKISVHVAQLGLITQSEVKTIPTGDRFRTRRTHGNLIVAISDEYSAYKQQISKKRDQIEAMLGPEVLNIALSHKLGLVLSDFFEVLPRDKAAAILLSCADPEIAEAILKGEGHQGLIGDTQLLAAEAIVLMPVQVRHEIFEEMVKIDPKFGGKVDLFFRTLIANFHQTGSGGASLIYKNLKDEEASTKVLEFQDDFGPLGQIVRAHHNKPS